jgi:hypothetical protein
MKSFLIFLLFGFLLSLLHLYCGRRPLHYDDPPYLSGWVAESPVKTETVTLALDADGFNKLEAAYAAERRAEWLEMLRGGRFFPVHNGTRVIILERGPSVSRVRIRRDGREAYVQNRYIVME